MKRMFDITDFGAIGDGKTNSTEAIQKALDIAAECGGTVTVPPGCYLTGKLKLSGVGVSLVGSSAWSFRRDGGSVLILSDEGADCLLDISGAFGCSIRNICLDGQGLGENIHGIKLYHEDYNGGGEEDTPTLDDVRVGNFSGDGLHFEHVWCFSVRHSMLHRNGGAGLYIDGWDGFILDNWFTANKNGGVLGGDAIASITATGNRVEWNGRGGFIFPFGNSFNITGNFFDRSFGPALIFGDTDKAINTATVTGNVFRRSGALMENESFANEHLNSHVVMKNSSGVVLSANSMRIGKNDDGSGNISPNYAVVIENCENSVVKDNAMLRGYVLEGVVSLGENTSCIVKDNVG